MTLRSPKSVVLALMAMTVKDHDGTGEFNACHDARGRRNTSDATYGLCA
jgi:hypothetical protein